MLDYVINSTKSFLENMPKSERKKKGQFFTSKETAEFMADMQESMMQSGYNKDNMSKLASDRLDALLNGYGSENIVSW